MQFAAELQCDRDGLRLPTVALQRYFESLFDAEWRQQSALYALAAVAHAGVHKLNHKTLTRSMTVLGCTASEAGVFTNAFRSTHPSLHCAIWPGLPDVAAKLLVGLPNGRKLAAAFFFGSPPADIEVLPGVQGPLVLAALLAAGGRIQHSQAGTCQRQ